MFTYSMSGLRERRARTYCDGQVTSKELVKDRQTQ